MSGLILTERRNRVLQAMDRERLDALILGVAGNVAFFSGANSLWTAGSRPFAPSCVVVGRDLHLLSTWDEGVPEDIPNDNLFGLSWNPSIAAASIGNIPALREARRIGVDGTSAGFQRMMAKIAPEATIVDFRASLDAARAAKTEAEIAGVEGACAVAASGLDAMHAAAVDGVTERHLLAVLTRALGEAGWPITPDESVARATADSSGSVVRDRELRAGELVALSPSTRVEGFEGTIARTVAVGGDPDGDQADLGRQTRRALDAVIAVCAPGATGADLVAAWAGAGGGELPMALAHGLGIGVEPPIVGMGVGAGEVLASGMVLAVNGWLQDATVGGWLERDVVAVTESGPHVLTAMATGALT